MKRDLERGRAFASGRFGRCAGQRDRAHEVQVGERPPAFLEAESVAREELVRHGEPDEAQRQLLDEPSVRAGEERHGGETRRLAKTEGATEEVQREPGVDDVLDEQYVTAFERRVDVFQKPDSTVLPVSVRSELDDIEGVGNAKRSRQVGEEDDARLQWSHEDGIETVVRIGDLGAELRDPGGDLRPREVHAADLAVLGVMRKRHYD